MADEGSFVIRRGGLFRCSALSAFISDKQSNQDDYCNSCTAKAAEDLESGKAVDGFRTPVIWIVELLFEIGFPDEEHPVSAGTEPTDEENDEKAVHETIRTRSKGESICRVKTNQVWETIVTPLLNLIPHCVDKLQDPEASSN